MISQNITMAAVKSNQSHHEKFLAAAEASIAAEKEATYMNLGWHNEKLNKQMRFFDPTGMIRIKDRTTVEKIQTMIKEGRSKKFADKIIDGMKQQIEWELNMVRNQKMDPKLAHKKVYEDPLVIEQLKFQKMIRENDKKKIVDYKKPKHLAIVKKLDDLFYSNIPSDQERLGLERKELQFGDSLFCDFYTLGGRKNSELSKIQAKESGFYSPKSKRHHVPTDYDVESLKKIELEEVQDYQYFHDTAAKLINEPYIYRQNRT